MSAQLLAISYNINSDHLLYVSHFSNEYTDFDLFV